MELGQGPGEKLELDEQGVWDWKTRDWELGYLRL